MLRHFLRVSACISLAATMAACATVTRGVKEGWTVESSPPYASVTTSNGFSCAETPCTFKMLHKATFDVTVTKPGYKPFHAHVIHQVSRDGGLGLAGNVLVGGMVGVVVDVASGAMMELKPNPLVVTLEPDGTPAGQAAAQAMPEGAVARF